MSSTKYITQMLKAKAPIHRASESFSHDDDFDIHDHTIQASKSPKKELTREQVLALIQGMQPGADNQPN